MKKLLLGICALLSILPLLAQQRRLTVIDAQSKKPLTGVTIELPNGNTVMTDVDGNAIIPTNSTFALLSSIGYRNTKITIGNDVDRRGGVQTGSVLVSQMQVAGD